MMNSYMPPAMNNFQVLDFTSKFKPEEKMEQPVLDLSCKKQPFISGSFGAVQPDNSSNSSLNSVNEEQVVAANLTLSSSRKGSPFEVRTFMVTPPSETESPGKPKYDEYYNPINVPSIDQVGFRNYSNPPIHLPIPIVAKLPAVPNILPPMMVQNNNDNNNDNNLHQIQMPRASSTTPDFSTMPSDCSKRSARPFKAYPKDPLSMSVVSELMYDQNSNDAYSEFRKKMLDSVRKSSEGTNIKMRRMSKSPNLPTSTMDEKNAAYWERRRKNNEAAKRSRDARRAKEDEIAIRAAFLEQENLKLKYELVALRNETAKLRCMIYSN